MRRLRAWIARHRVITAIVVALAAALLAGGVWYGMRDGEPDKQPLERLFKDYQSYLLGLPGVTSVGIGERSGKRFIQVYVRELTPKIAAGIPETFGGWQVRVKEISDPSPSPESPEPSPTPTELPDPETVVVDARGIISGVTRLSEPQGRILGWILVEGHPEPGMVSDRTSVAITTDTAFFRLQGAELVQTDVPFTDEELRGKAVEVEFEGDVVGVDPVQATGAVVVFVTAES
jgi:hypothetical protein